MSTNIGGNVNTNLKDGSNDVLLNVTRSMDDEKQNASIGAFVAANDQRGPKMGSVGAFATANSNNHGASLGVTHTPKYNMTIVEAAATANLWTSSNQATSLNAHVNTSRHLSGQMKGHESHGYGFSINHRF